MKRSEINKIIKESITFFEEMNFKLPPFAFFSKSDWENKEIDNKEIIDLQLGWDITDFGNNEFIKEGLLLFTLRNGTPDNSEYPKSYAEKIMIVREKQYTPMHYHWYKMEDIINRGGGNLQIEFFQADEKDQLSGVDIILSFDGIKKTIKAGEIITLLPGDSVTIPQKVYHRFCGEVGKGIVLTGEVSMVNDDSKDNKFFDPHGRFPEIEEDEPPYRLIVSDYAKYK
jgi:D-lyxose ketol-isomerase